MINSGLGDSFFFLPFALALYGHGIEVEICGNKYIGPLCEDFGAAVKTSDTESVLRVTDPAAHVARIKRTGTQTVVEIYQAAAVFAGGERIDLAAAKKKVQEKIKIEKGEHLLVDLPRKSGTGSTLYTPTFCAVKNEIDRAKKIECVKQARSVTLQKRYIDILRLMSEASAGVGQIGFLSAAAWLLDKKFYAVAGQNESTESFARRKKVVML